MSEVKVCFCPVISDKNLSMLKRAECAGINIDIRVELLDRHLQSLASRSAPIEAAAIPFPRDETTPPVTKMNLGIFLSFPSLQGYPPRMFRIESPLPLSSNHFRAPATVQVSQYISRLDGSIPASARSTFRSVAVNPYMLKHLAH